MSSTIFASVLSNATPGGGRAQIAPARGDNVRTLNAGLVDIENRSANVTHVTPVNVTVRADASRIRVEPAAGHSLSTRRFEREAARARSQQRSTTAHWTSSLLVQRSFVCVGVVACMIAAAWLLFFLVQTGTVTTSHLTLSMLCIFIAGWLKSSRKFTSSNRMETEFWSTAALGPESAAQRLARTRTELTPREAFMRECMAPDATVRRAHQPGCMCRINDCVLVFI